MCIGEKTHFGGTTLPFFLQSIEGFCDSTLLLKAEELGFLLIIYSAQLNVIVIF